MITYLTILVALALCFFWGYTIGYINASEENGDAE
jgi:hypothetical protein